MRILAFNWHEPYLYNISQTGHELVLIDPSIQGIPRLDGIRGWNSQVRPLPSNISIITNPNELYFQLIAQQFDCFMSVTPGDLFWLNTIRPRIQIPILGFFLCVFSGEFGHPSPEEKRNILKIIQSWAKECFPIFTSEESKKSWGMDGLVVGPCVDSKFFHGYSGDNPVITRVGGAISSRSHFNYNIQEEIIKGFPCETLDRLGNTPKSRIAQNIEDVRETYRRNRLYLHTFSPTIEEWGGLSLFEAMGTGMPVISTPHPGSHIRNGYNGFISDDISFLRNKTKELLENQGLAQELGNSARNTILTLYPFEQFLYRIDTAFKKCKEKFKSSSTFYSVPDDLQATYESEGLVSQGEMREFVLAPISPKRIKFDTEPGCIASASISFYRTDSGQYQLWHGFRFCSNEKGEYRMELPGYLAWLPQPFKTQLCFNLWTFFPLILRTMVLPCEFYLNILPDDPIILANNIKNVFIPYTATAVELTSFIKQAAFLLPHAKGKTTLDLNGGIGALSKFLCRVTTRSYVITHTQENTIFARRHFKDPKLEIITELQSILKNPSIHIDMILLSIHNDFDKKLQNQVFDFLSLLKPGGELWVLGGSMEEIEPLQTILKPCFHNTTPYGQKEEIHEIWNTRDQCFILHASGFIGKTLVENQQICR